MKRITSERLSIAGIATLILVPILYVGMFLYNQYVIYSLVDSRSMVSSETDVDAKLQNAENIVVFTVALSAVMVVTGFSLLIMSYLKKRAGK